MLLVRACVRVCVFSRMGGGGGLKVVRLSCEESAAAREGICVTLSLRSLIKNAVIMLIGFPAELPGLGDLISPQKKLSLSLSVQPFYLLAYLFIWGLFFQSFFFFFFYVAKYQRCVAPLRENSHV